MPTRAGARNQRVTIIAATVTQDATGAEVLDWATPTTVATVWAEVVPVRGMERMESAKLDATIEYKFRILYRSDVTPLHRVEWRDEQYDITAVIPDVDKVREGLELLATAHQADADG
jgi:SPP1 family predicted phage head-tail adaptor